MFPHKGRRSPIKSNRLSLVAWRSPSENFITIYPELLSDPANRQTLKKLRQKHNHFCGVENNSNICQFCMHIGIVDKKAQLPLRNRASAMHFFIARLLSIAVITENYALHVRNLRPINR